MHHWFTVVIVYLNCDYESWGHAHLTGCMDVSWVLANQQHGRVFLLLLECKNSGCSWLWTGLQLVCPRFSQILFLCTMRCFSIPLSGFQHSADRYRCSSLHMKASVLPVSCGGSICQCYNVHLLCKHRCLCFLQFAIEDWKKNNGLLQLKWTPKPSLLLRLWCRSFFEPLWGLRQGHQLQRWAISGFISVTHV